MTRPGTLLLALAASLMAVGASGCGGAQKKVDPMVADDTSSSESGLPPDLRGDDDGGAATTDSDKSEKSADGAAPSGHDTKAAQGDAEGAHALLEQFVVKDADHGALTRALRPTTNDYKAMFDAPSAAKIEAGQAKDWDSNKAVVKPKPNQSEVKLWSASGADLAAGKGNAREFPAEYKKVGKHLAPTVLFYRFKFVEVGKEQGTAYDGLAFVNGRWVLAPKPWLALSGKGEGHEGHAGRGGHKKKK